MNSHVYCTHNKDNTEVRSNENFSTEAAESPEEEIVLPSAEEIEALTK